MDFFVDVLKGGRGWHFVGNGKGQTMGLVGTMIGVLTEDDDLDLVEWSGIEGVEDKLARWIHSGGSVLVFDKLG